MKEVRPPKRPLIFYYCVAMLVLLLFNFLAMPWLAQQQIREVDYGTFMDMAEDTSWARWRSRSRRTRSSSPTRTRPPSTRPAWCRTRT